MKKIDLYFKIQFNNIYFKIVMLKWLLVFDLVNLMKQRCVKKNRLQRFFHPKYVVIFTHFLKFIQ